jgi:2-phosphosulfolactate phosphatase
MSAEQARYQVRFDWGLSGVRAVGTDADVMVWVDALSAPGGAPIELPHTSAVIVAATLPDSLAVARWIVDFQQGSGKRIAIAVIAAGEPRADGELRFAWKTFSRPAL